MMNQIKTNYRQRVKHIQPIGKCYFVTFKLYGSVPQALLREVKYNYESRLQKLQSCNLSERDLNYNKLKLRKQMLIKHDRLLESRKAGPHYLKKTEIADLCKEQLHRFDGEYYELLAYTIMSNHIHLVIDTQVQLENLNYDLDLINDNYLNLDQIMKRIKGPIAKYCNRMLNRVGQFWDRESYDIYMRNEKMLGNVIRYVVNNPVKAGLAGKWEDYPHTYLNSRYEI